MERGEEERKRKRGREGQEAYDVIQLSPQN